MGYHETKFKAAQSLWTATGLAAKGDLLDEDMELVKHLGLSSGEAVIYGICAAIVDPNKPMPPLTDIAFHLSEKHKRLAMQAILDVLIS